MTAVLFGVLIVLAGIVYYVSKQPTPQQVQSKAQHPQIVSFKPTDVLNLVLTDGKKTVSIDKSGAGWQITKPVTEAADSTQVGGLLDQLGNLTADRVIQGSTDLASYGLTKPSLNVQVGLQGGKTVKLAFGDKTPDGSEYYAQLSTAKNVYLVSASLGDDLKTALNQPPKALPTPTLVPTQAGSPTVAPSAAKTVTPSG